MRETKFFINTGQQSAMLNKLLRSTGLADGAVIPNGVGYEITVQWEDSVVLDANHVRRTRNALSEAFESSGIAVLGINFMG